MKSTKPRKLKLKASARDNRRYLIVKEIDSEKIEKAILDYVGVLGFAKSAYIKVKSVSGKTIIGVRREELNNVRASFAFAGIFVEKVSGTLKGLGK